MVDFIIPLNPRNSFDESYVMFTVACLYLENPVTINQKKVSEFLFYTKKESIPIE